MEADVKTLLKEIEKSLHGHKESVADTIRVTVNGKIDKLTHSVMDWQKEEGEKRVAIEKKLDEYIQTTKPMVEFFEDVTSSKKVLFWMLGFFGTIGGGWLLLREIFFNK